MIAAVSKTNTFVVRLVPEHERKALTFYDLVHSLTDTAVYEALWEEWLGMKLSIATMYLSRKRVIAECLWEMTFISNEQTEIQMKFGCLLGTIEEVKDAIDKGDVEYT